MRKASNGPSEEPLFTVHLSALHECVNEGIPLTICYVIFFVLINYSQHLQMSTLYGVLCFLAAKESMFQGMPHGHEADFFYSPPTAIPSYVGDLAAGCVAALNVQTGAFI